MSEGRKTAVSPRRWRRVQEARAHWSEAFGLGLSLTGDRARAEDLAQEALLRLARTPREPGGAGSLRGLVLRTVRNLAIDETRRTTPESLDMLNETAGLSQDHRSPDPAEEVCTREEVARVREALGRMSPDWRAMLYLRDGMGLGYAEIASVLGKSRDVVRVTLHRARQRIRSLLGELVKEELE